MKLFVSYMQTEVKKENKVYEELIKVALDTHLAMPKKDMVPKIVRLLMGQADIMSYDVAYIRMLLCHHYDADQNLFDGYSAESLFGLALETLENQKIYLALIKIGELFDEWIRTTGEYFADIGEN